MEFEGGGHVYVHFILWHVLGACAVFDLGNKSTNVLKLLTVTGPYVIHVLI